VAVSRFTREGIGSLTPAPANRFSHALKLAGPDDRFVSINNDTIYSIAQIDVSGGPMLRPGLTRTIRSDSARSACWRRPCFTLIARRTWPRR
jgi:hypothetical protein